MLTRPLCVYINWAAYDELSDAVELTEPLAMRQLDELLRLRTLGVRLDAYLMDAFWYAPSSGYREWRKPHWPDGPDRWLQRCQENNVLPGLWFAGNNLHQLKVIPAWADSLDAGGCGMSLSHGGFLTHWLETAQQWYARGVRLFKLDFFTFSAAPAAVRENHLPSAIRRMNAEALRQGLAQLRQACPEIVFLGYNGFEEEETQKRTDQPFRRTVDPRWLDVFDSLYCGDPRPADVPAMNFWRAKDVYTDHLVQVYRRNGFDPTRIDNAGFMIGTTGTCYFRKTAAWLGMLILSLARGGWINTYYGNLDLLDDTQGSWFARVQALFLHLQQHGRIASFGGIPGQGQPYGYVAEDERGALYTVVNPAQAIETLRLPNARHGRILFQDDGPAPVLDENGLRLGPEQMAVVGTGEFDHPAFDLGHNCDVLIPSFIARLTATFRAVGDKAIAAHLPMPADGGLRIVFRQFDKNGRVHRTTGGSPPHGTTLGKLLSIEARHAGHELPLQIQYDKAIWSGLSWAVAELPAQALPTGRSVEILCRSRDSAEVILQGEVYQTRYDNRPGLSEGERK